MFGPHVTTASKLDRVIGGGSSAFAVKVKPFNYPPFCIGPNLRLSN